MVKQSFTEWIILLLAGGIFVTGLFAELGKAPWNLQNIGILILFAYLIYKASIER